MSPHQDNDDNLSDADSWHNIGELTDLSDLEASLISGNATLTINSTTRLIDIVYVDTDSTTTDEFGVGVEGSSNFNFTTGDTVSWSGSLVAPIDLNDLSTSGIPATFTSSAYGFNNLDVLDLEVNIGIPAPTQSTPEPATVLGLLTLGSLAALTRKRKA